LNTIIGLSEVQTDRMFGELTEKQEESLKDIYASGIPRRRADMRDETAPSFWQLPIPPRLRGQKRAAALHNQLVSNG